MKINLWWQLFGGAFVIMSRYNQIHHFTERHRMSDARTAPTSPAFDEFLFAVIREETNGTPLSMISALTRLGLEPWQEAARLAALPAAAAAEALATLLGRLPPGVAPSEPVDGNRLIAGL